MKDSGPLYLSTKDLLAVDIDWRACIATIEEAVHIMASGAYVQPLKPYLRFNDLRNRIIAMPAYLGGKINIAGIKWIASFPKNIEKGVPRAHSIVVLNHAEEGCPVAIIGSTLLSGIRTAAVSGLMISHCLRVRDKRGLKVGIVGYGPIGKLHVSMLHTVFGGRISEILVYDIRPVDPSELSERSNGIGRIVDTWQEAYINTDIFITATVSDHRYVNLPPKRGALLLNVSLRDFLPEAFSCLKAIVVDDWDEVCRENTDIEFMHRKHQLNKAQTKSIIDVVCQGAIKALSADEPVMFNPMGLAIFDLAIGQHFYAKALAKSMGQRLES